MIPATRERTCREIVQYAIDQARNAEKLQMKEGLYVVPTWFVKDAIRHLRGYDKDTLEHWTRCLRRDLHVEIGHGWAHIEESCLT